MRPSVRIARHAVSQFRTHGSAPQTCTLSKSVEVRSSECRGSRLLGARIRMWRAHRSNPVERPTIRNEQTHAEELDYSAFGSSPSAHISFQSSSERARLALRSLEILRSWPCSSMRFFFFDQSLLLCLRSKRVGVSNFCRLSAGRKLI